MTHYSMIVIIVALILVAQSISHGLETVAPSPNSPLSTTTAPAAEPDRTEKEIEGKTATKIFRGRSGFFKKLPPRSERTPAERKQHIERLRIAYAASPQEWPLALVDSSVDAHEIGMLPQPVIAQKGSPEALQVELGKHLFFDARLSSSRQIACASCHDPDLSWTDGRTVSFGHERTSLARNAPTIANSGELKQLFWDGRADSLETQARAVLLNPNEMHSTEELIVERVAKIPGYLSRFEKAYPDESITLDLVCKAIAQFERSVVGGRSRFDKFLQGNSNALSDESLVGLDLFRREAACMNCHHGPSLTDSKTHVVGLSYYGRKYQDLGRYEQTKQPEDTGAFRTPSLRNVSRTGPYMHNGLFPRLRGVLNMYNAGMPTLVPKNQEQMDDPIFPQKTRLLKPLGLNKQDLADLESFLRALEEPPLRVRPPEKLLPEPDLLGEEQEKTIPPLLTDKLPLAESPIRKQLEK